MTRRNAYARIEQISIQALWCKRVHVVMHQLGTVLNRLQVKYATDASYCEPVFSLFVYSV